MSNSPFPGYPVFLDTAAAALGHPEAAAPARRIVTLAALGNLCAQTADADEIQLGQILAKAEEFGWQLQAAARAAELMLADLQSRRKPAIPPRNEPETASTASTTVTAVPSFPARMCPRGMSGP